MTFHVRPYRFGGRRIPELFPKKQGVPEGIVAETWEVTDHGKENSVVLNGPLAGVDLHTLVQTFGPRLLGTKVKASAGGGYPLLLKFLDAATTLGMQVHPDDEYAAEHEPGENGKTESWYVIAANPGAILFCGNVDNLTREELEKAIAEGNPERCMKEIPVAVGDEIYVPAGRMHAIGKGLLVYEAQQSCDMTYGPRPWGTIDEATKKLRIRKFVEACHLENLGEQRIPAVSVVHGKNERAFLLANRFFVTERLRLAAPWHQHLDGTKSLAYSCLKGSGRFVAANGSAFEPTTFTEGESTLVPAGSADYIIEPDGECELLVSYVPGDLVADVIAPLRELGVSPAAIAALGGPGASNDVAPLLFS